VWREPVSQYFFGIWQKTAANGELTKTCGARWLAKAGRQRGLAISGLAKYVTNADWPVTGLIL
jgi:hypothetical protein